MKIGLCPGCEDTVELSRNGVCTVCGAFSGIEHIRLVSDSSIEALNALKATEMAQERCTAPQSVEVGSVCGECKKSVPSGQSYCGFCGTPVRGSRAAIETLEQRVERLEKELDDTDKIVEQHAKLLNKTVIPRVSEVERHLKSSSVFSEGFWTRAWAVFGHQLAAGAIIYIVILLMAYVLTAGR